jgi:hypothetical protein
MRDTDYLTPDGTTMSDIRIEPGRLALRRPELGGFLMVEVREAGSLVFLADNGTGTERWQFPKREWLPVLRPGDAVPAGSLLWDAWHGRAYPPEPILMTFGGMDNLRYALLRYGPEEATDE